MEKEKYSPKIRALKKIIEKSTSPVLITHNNPDGDALGATFAVQEYLLSEKKKVTFFYTGKADSAYSFLPYYQDKCEKEPNFKEADLIILLDASEIKRADALQKYFLTNPKEQREKLVFIDHHADHPKEEHLFALCLREKAATCQLIYDYFLENKLVFNKNIALCLLTGLFSDTGGFMHANTTSSVMQMASDLMHQGVSLSQIAKRVFANKKINTLRIWGKALERASLNKKNKVAFSYVTRKDLAECKAEPEDLSGVTNILGAAEDSRYSLFLAEMGGNKVKGSLRSEEYKNCDVSKIARRLGGGGHKLASGFEFRGRISSQKGRMKIK